MTVAIKKNSITTWICTVLLIGFFIILSLYNMESVTDNTYKGYTKTDDVPVSMNKAWPSSNTVETYSFYDTIPFCQPQDITYYSMSFGQIMRGDKLVTSLYRIKYLENVQSDIVCSMVLEKPDMNILREKIDESYFYELYLADFPVHVPIGGRNEKHKYFLNTHILFIINYKDGAIISVETMFRPQIVDFDTDLLTVDYKYSVSWRNAENADARGVLYTKIRSVVPTNKPSDFVHSVSITNAFILTSVVIALLITITLKIVRSDLSKYIPIQADDEFAADNDAAWKLLHADVFRPPAHRMWFSAVIGCGAQLFLVVVAIIVVGCFAPYVGRGPMLILAFACYMITSLLAGYLSSYLYAKLGGIKWAWNIVITALMFMGPFALIWSFLNTVGLAYRSTAAIPFTTGLLLFGGWLFVTLPLTIAGGVTGRRHAKYNAQCGRLFPCKTNKLAREIPTVRWHSSPTFQMITAGFLPFSAIYIELHFVLSSVWTTHEYELYGILLLAFVMLFLVAGSVSVLLTYFHLNAEDHKWWWRSAISGGSVAIYFYLHCFVYFFKSTRMYGFLQVSYYFGFCLAAAWALCLMMAFVTFASTYCFVRYIYSRIKAE